MFCPRKFVIFATAMLKPRRQASFYGYWSCSSFSQTLNELAKSHFPQSISMVRIVQIPYYIHLHAEKQVPHRTSITGVCRTNSSLLIISALTKSCNMELTHHPSSSPQLQPRSGAKLAPPAHSVPHKSRRNCGSGTGVAAANPTRIAPATAAIDAKRMFVMSQELRAG